MSTGASQADVALVMVPADGNFKPSVWARLFLAFVFYRDRHKGEALASCDNCLHYEEVLHKETALHNH